VNDATLSDVQFGIGKKRHTELARHAHYFRLSVNCAQFFWRSFACQLHIRRSTCYCFTLNSNTRTVNTSEIHIRTCEHHCECWFRQRANADNGGTNTGPRTRIRCIDCLRETPRPLHRCRCTSVAQAFSWPRISLSSRVSGLSHLSDASKATVASDEIFCIAVAGDLRLCEASGRKGSSRYR
jgi:hypothetical protein